MVILKLEEQPQLIQAIFCGEIEDVRTILEGKPDVNYQDCEKRSPLHAAAYRGIKELVQLLIAQGARVNTKDSKWYTPLHRACGVGSEETVELLLKHNADTCARDRQWQTPLHIAAANNAIECVSHLLTSIPNVNVTDRAGRTALHHAALNGHSDVVELLISRGCIVNACDKKDCRPIHCASHLGHVDTLEQLLHNGADVDVKDRNQYTPLHAAAASGMVYACRLLLNSGADVNVQNAYGNTPLHIACLNGHLNICTELISFNADFEMVNYKGQTPVHIAAASTHGMPCLQSLMENNANINRHSMDGRTALHMSAIHGRFTRSKALIDNGAVIDAMDKNGATALHVAAQYGHDILSSTLLSHGADPTKRGYQGRTPLHITCLSGFVECCRKFTQVISDINLRDDTGKTPIHCAAYKGSVECLDLLVSQGGDFKLEDYFGGTALHYAASRGHYNCVFTLVGIGTPVNVVDQEGCTALHLAAAFDHEGRCVQYLLQHKADAKMKDRHGFTPIYYAISNSNTNALEFLLEAVGKNYTLYGPDMPLTTPLHIAAKRGDIKILKLIIPYFPDTNIRDANGVTALLLAAREGHTHGVQMLLRYGAKVAICEEQYQMSPVHYSAKNGHMHCLALLVDNAEDKTIIDRPDRLNRTALMLAVSGCHRECVLTLLKSNSDPNVVDSDKHSSLFRAVVTGQNNVAQLLITKGALVTPADCTGKTVLHLAAAFGQFACLQTILNYTSAEEAAICDNEQFNALHWACYNGNTTCLEYLLSKDFFKEIDGNIFSPVHCAIFAGSERCLELLYNRYGAQIVKLTDARKRTPLHMAALHGHTECARYLLEQGADINIKDEMGRTPLIAAAQNGQSQIIDLLVGHKADVTEIDSNGNTALHLACLKRHNRTALLILEYIKDVDIINMSNNDRKTPLHLAARNGLVDVTRDLIKKGSAVLAVDSNGLTPALCCAPNASVAQCLAIILANHPVQFPNDSKSSKDCAEFLETIFRHSQPLSHKIATQTEISLLRDPREIFQDVAQRVQPKLMTITSTYNKLDPKRTHRRILRPAKNTNVPNWHKMPPDCPKTNQNRRKSEVKRCGSSGLIFIEAYDTTDCFEPKVNKEHCGLGLHRSFSDIALAPNEGPLGDIPLDAVHKDSVNKLITGYKTVAKKMAELTKMYDVSYDDISRIYMNHCNETNGASDEKRAEIEAKVSGKLLVQAPEDEAQSSTSQPPEEIIPIPEPAPRSCSLIHNRHVEKYDDVFKKILGKRGDEFKLDPDIINSELNSGGDSAPKLSAGGLPIRPVRSKRRCCEFVCAKCVNTNMFDPPEDVEDRVVKFSYKDDCPEIGEISLMNTKAGPSVELLDQIKDLRLDEVKWPEKSDDRGLPAGNAVSYKKMDEKMLESDDDFQENRSELRIVELDASDEEEREIRNTNMDVCTNNTKSGSCSQGVDYYDSNACCSKTVDISCGITTKTCSTGTNTDQFPVHVCFRCNKSLSTYKRDNSTDGIHNKIRICDLNSRVMARGYPRTPEKKKKPPPPIKIEDRIKTNAYGSEILDLDAFMESEDGSKAAAKANPCADDEKTKITSSNNKENEEESGLKKDATDAEVEKFRRRNTEIGLFTSNYALTHLRDGMRDDGGIKTENAESDVNVNKKEAEAIHQLGKERKCLKEGSISLNKAFVNKRKEGCPKIAKLPAKKKPEESDEDVDVIKMYRHCKRSDDDESDDAAESTITGQTGPSTSTKLEEEANCVSKSYKIEEGVNFEGDIEIFSPENDVELEHVFSATGGLDELFDCDKYADDLDVENFDRKSQNSKDSSVLLEPIVTDVYVRRNDLNEDFDLDLGAKVVDENNRFDAPENALLPAYEDHKQSEEAMQIENICETFSKDESSHPKSEPSFSKNDNQGFVQKALKSVYSKTKGIANQSKTAVSSCPGIVEATPPIERYVYQTLENAYRSEIDFNKLEEIKDGKEEKFQHQTLGNAYRLEIELNAKCVDENVDDASEHICPDALVEIEDSETPIEDYVIMGGENCVETSSDNIDDLKAPELNQIICNTLGKNDDFIEERFIEEENPEYPIKINDSDVTSDKLSLEIDEESSGKPKIGEEEVTILGQPKEIELGPNMSMLVSSEDTPSGMNHQTILTNSEIFELRREAISREEDKVLKTNQLLQDDFYLNSFLTRSECQLNENFETNLAVTELKNNEVRIKQALSTKTEANDEENDVLKVEDDGNESCITNKVEEEIVIETIELKSEDFHNTCYGQENSKATDSTTNLNIKTEDMLKSDVNIQLENIETEPHSTNSSDCSPKSDDTTNFGAPPTFEHLETNEGDACQKLVSSKTMLTSNDSSNMSKAEEVTTNFEAPPSIEPLETNDGDACQKLVYSKTSLKQTPIDVSNMAKVEEVTTNIETSPTIEHLETNKRDACQKLASSKTILKLTPKEISIMLKADKVTTNFEAPPTIEHLETKEGDACQKLVSSKTILTSNNISNMSKADEEVLNDNPHNANSSAQIAANLLAEVVSANPFESDNSMVEDHGKYDKHSGLKVRKSVTKKRIKRGSDDVGRCAVS